MVTQNKHIQVEGLGDKRFCMTLRRRTITELADMICGNEGFGDFFIYRSSGYISEIFADCGFDEYIHDGSTRKWWVADTLQAILSKATNKDTVPDELVEIISALMDRADAIDNDENRAKALKTLNDSLARDNLNAYYDSFGVCQLRLTKTLAVSSITALPERAWTAEEQEKRQELIQFLNKSSEDDIIEEILLPLFRQLGFQRITSEGHKERILEYGKDIWMKYRLPTLHFLYFGIQVKKGKIGAAGRSSNSNVAEIHNQILMMLGHELFDPETNKRSLVDHAFIIAGGEITKQARNWLGGKLDASQRSQTLFMDRDDILNLMLTHKVPIPARVEGIPF